MTDGNGAMHPDDCACWDCITNHIEERARLELKDEWLGIGLDPIETSDLYDCNGHFLPQGNKTFADYPWVDAVYNAARTLNTDWLEQQLSDASDASDEKHDALIFILGKVVDYELFWQAADSAMHAPKTGSHMKQDQIDRLEEFMRLHSRPARLAESTIEAIKYAIRNDHGEWLLGRMNRAADWEQPLIAELIRNYNPKAH